ncbi:S-adenosyl-L-methionine-dependent methyltransferase [Suillus americanus]|nr:S-adenosyl-L-methionine-dependent methyltransferase [Suillus americanus]
MHSIPESLYFLPTDEPERKRLNLQNEVFRKALGNSIVFAPIKLHTGDKVLDSGTGSAAWLLDCYNANKDATFYGIDLKTDMFPRLNDEQKQQIHLDMENILQLPGLWTDSFQLVNQRLLMTAFSQENWDTALEQIYRVLAPGGWVQLVEISQCISGERSREFYAMFRDLFSKRGVLNDCADHIPKFLKDAGFDQVKAQRYELSIGGPPDSGGINAEARKSFNGANRRMLSTVVTLGIRTEEEYKEMVEDLEREWENDAQSKMIFYVFLGQKPLAAYDDK